MVQQPLEMVERSVENLDLVDAITERYPIAYLLLPFLPFPTLELLGWNAIGGYFGSATSS